MRKSSVDLRKEILEVGGTEYLFKLHKKEKKKEEEKPEPEPEEIVGEEKKKILEKKGERSIFILSRS